MRVERRRFSYRCSVAGSLGVLPGIDALERLQTFHSDKLARVVPNLQFCVQRGWPAIPRF